MRPIRTPRIPTADLMKKGLRRPRPALFARVATIPTADLMKKGLRPHRAERVSVGEHSNSRPDEEGIKTPPSLPELRDATIPTADLMKKGLRRPVRDADDTPPVFQQQT